MQPIVTGKAITEPANRGLRFLLIALALLVGACASTPDPEPEPAPLEDRTPETDYRLDAAAEKLDQARGVELEGNRSLAAMVYDTAKKMLPEDHERERRFIDVMKAGVWAQPGEDRDGEKSEALLTSVEKYARANDDRRLLSDVEQIRVLSALVEDDLTAAERHAERALAHLWEAGAYLEYVEVAGELAYQFLDSEHGLHAEVYALYGHDVAHELDDDWAIMRAGIDCGTVLLAARITPLVITHGESYFLEAYEAAYRLGELGWRDIVIVTAVRALYEAEVYDRAVQWGDRMRNRERGLFPHVEQARLWPEDYLLFLAQYAFSQEETGENAEREQEARRAALEIIEGVPGEERDYYSELEEKLRDGLLQHGGEK